MQLHIVDITFFWLKMASLNDQKVLAFMFDPFLLDAMNNEEDKLENGSTSESGMLQLR